MYGPVPPPGDMRLEGVMQRVAAEVDRRGWSWNSDRRICTACPHRLRPDHLAPEAMQAMHRPWAVRERHGHARRKDGGGCRGGMNGSRGGRGRGGMGSGRARSGGGGNNSNSNSGRSSRRPSSAPATVIDTMAPLEMFRRFLVYACKGNVPEAYRRRKDVFPCSCADGGDGGSHSHGRHRRRHGRNGRGSNMRLIVYADGDDGYVVNSEGRPIVRAGVGLLCVPPGGRVNEIDYRSSSGRTFLTWMLDPDHARRRLGRVSGTATAWSLQYLGVAGVVTTKWAIGQGPIMRAKMERAKASWPATPDLRMAGYSRRERRDAERRDLESGARLRFPTGYDGREDGGRWNGREEFDGAGIPGMSAEEAVRAQAAMAAARGGVGNACNAGAAGGRHGCS